MRALLRQRNAQLVKIGLKQLAGAGKSCCIVGGCSIVAKTFYKKFSCTVSFDDIFRSLASYQRYTINGVSTNGVYYEDIRAFSVALKYTIGQLRDSKYKNKEVNDNAGRIR